MSLARIPRRILTPPLLSRRPRGARASYELRKLPRATTPIRAERLYALGSLYRNVFISSASAVSFSVGECIGVISDDQ